MDLHPSLMSLLSFFSVVPRALSDPAGLLSLELTPSAIAEANTAVNSVQQAKTKKRGPYVKNMTGKYCGCGVFI